MYDLVIRNGVVVDPAQACRNGETWRSRAVALRTVAKEIPRIGVGGPGRVRTSRDAGADRYSRARAPGVSHYGSRRTPLFSPRGDDGVRCGSAGADTFDGLRRYSSTSPRRGSWLPEHLAIGMVSPLDNELEDSATPARSGAIGVVERNRDVIQGIKARLSRRHVGRNDLEPLRLARRPPSRGDADDGPRRRHPVAAGAILAELRQGIS